jgi:hypothetical protein
MSKRGHYLGGHTVWYANHFRGHGRITTQFKPTSSGRAVADVHHEVQIGSTSASEAFVYDYLRRCQRAREPKQPEPVEPAPRPRPKPTPKKRKHQYGKAND